MTEASYLMDRYEIGVLLCNSLNKSISSSVELITRRLFIKTTIRFTYMNTFHKEFTFIMRTFASF